MFRELDIDLLQLSPRRATQGIPYPSAEEVEALRLYGVTRPLTVRPLPDQPTRYEILSGETLWRAAQVIGLQRLPVYIRDDLTNEDAAALMAAEQEAVGSRNPVARARALRAALLAAPELNRTAIAQRLGMTLSSLSHHLRILELPEAVLHWMETGQLSYGQGRVLLGLAEPSERIELGRLAIRRRLSVRVLERAVRYMQNTGAKPVDAVANALTCAPKESPAQPPPSGPPSTPPPAAKSPEIHRLEETLTEQLGSPVTVEHRTDGGGELRIAYHDLEILDGILARILRQGSGPF